MRLFLTETVADEVNHRLDVVIPARMHSMILGGSLRHGTHEIPFSLAEMITLEIGFSIADMLGTRAWLEI